MTYDNKMQKMSQSQRRKFSRDIVNVINLCGFRLLNQEEIKSRRNYVQYKIDYDTEYSILSIKPHLIVETEVSVYSFPYEIMDADSLLYQYLKSQNLYNLIAEFKLEPFPIKTQSLERTYIDKIFALCDYYLTLNIQGHSRHLYDLFKIHPLIRLDNAFQNLIKEVRIMRSNNSKCLSAQQGVNISEVLQNIIKSDIFKSDYNKITKDLMFEDVSYQEVLETLKFIMNTGIF